MIWIVVIVVAILFGFAVFFGAPYVPSRRKFIRRAFTKLYPVGPKDVIVDIGSGDGVVLRVAAALGARAIGYEIHPLLVLISKILSAGNNRVKVRLANFWHVEVPADTTLIYTFSVSRDNKKLIRKIQQECDRLERPLNLMCYASPLPGITPVKTFEAYHLYRFHPLQPKEAQV
jgi:SAM-dependent methyltransferase